MCLFYVKPNFRNYIFLKNTQASSRLVIVLVEQIEIHLLFASCITCFISVNIYKYILCFHMY